MQGVIIIDPRTHSVDVLACVLRPACRHVFSPLSSRRPYCSSSSLTYLLVCVSSRIARCFLCICSHMYSCGDMNVHSFAASVHAVPVVRERVNVRVYEFVHACPHVSLWQILTHVLDVLLACVTDSTATASPFLCSTQLLRTQSACPKWEVQTRRSYCSTVHFHL